MSRKRTLKRSVPVACPILVGAFIVAACGDDEGHIQSTAGDPLYRYQWHLHNDGQQVFADIRPVPGIDLNMGTLFEQGITGRGVVVGIMEPGTIDPLHEDLIPNLVLKDGLGAAPQDRAAATPLPTRESSRLLRTMARVAEAWRPTRRFSIYRRLARRSSRRRELSTAATVCSRRGLCRLPWTRSMLISIVHRVRQCRSWSRLQATIFCTALGCRLMNVRH